MKRKEKKFKEIPHFKNEDEERDFWSKNSSTDYVDWSKAEEGEFQNLKPTTQSISIRLPIGLLGNIKVLANQMDVPYQSLIKMLLDESIKRKSRFIS